MNPTSLTIKIDFAAAGPAGGGNGVSLQGDIPTPFGFSPAGATAALGQSVDAAPTPFDNPSLGLSAATEEPPTPFAGSFGVDLSAPAPSPDINPPGAAASEEAAQPGETSKKGRK